ncbi:MAG TPA: glycosyltransferase [Thermoanaerobaculia bacterium]|nr:glycosyltransferase [Thermoanaerobaculia bacterium]
MSRAVLPGGSNAGPAADVAGPPGAEPTAAPALAPPADAPLVSGIVVHWHNEELLGELLAGWPREDPRFELLVVDNGSSAPLPLGPARLLRPGRNLGFAGGVNLGVAAARAELLLVLNPDVVPEPGAVDRLLEGFAACPDAAGLAPRMAGPRGEPQFAWQLRRLPSPWSCLLQTLAWPARPAARNEPPAGAAVEQPAAAALALRRSALGALGGFDAGFYPAWFEDVDLAHRLRRAGMVIRYWPAARFAHRLGGSVPRLGYGPFLWVYYRSLTRYLAKHHGRGWARAARASLLAGLFLRLLALPLRRPRRAASRRDAVRGLAAAMAGALSGWRRPRRMAERFRGPTPAGAAPEEPRADPAGGEAR